MYMSIIIRSGFKTNKKRRVIKSGNDFLIVESINSIHRMWTLKPGDLVFVHSTASTGLIRLIDWQDETALVDYDISVIHPITGIVHHYGKCCVRNLDLINNKEN